MNRQVFFYSLGGFDTHSGAIWGQWDLLRQVSDSIMALYNATIEMRVANQMTTSTESDFGRTLQPRGRASVGNVPYTSPPFTSAPGTKW